MNTKIKLLVVSALTAIFATASYASSVGFNGDYDYSTWSSYSDISGPSTTVNSIDGPQQVLTLMEPDGASYGGPCCPSGSNFFSHAVAGDGIVSFDWSFNWDIDACCSGLNFYINSTLYNLANGYPGNPYNYTGGDASGSFSAAVFTGDIITFGAFTADNCCRASTSVISNFDAPGVPDNGTTLSLLGLSLVGFAALRRKVRA